MSQSAKALKESSESQNELACFHCGQPCESEVFHIDDKQFCCYGCKTVYEILNENNLCEYYDFQKNPGVRLEGEQEAYHYLDEESVKQKLVQYEINGLTRVIFYVPAIHCISCLWLLENLNRLNPGIVKSEVNFARKVVTIDFNHDKVKLSEVAGLMAATGYKPLINLDESHGEVKHKHFNKRLLTQLAVAGFCFGNIMLLSFPEYLGIDRLDEQLQKVFSYLNVLLGIPVVLFSGRDYFTSAWKSFQQRQVNIDVPIAAGILVLFVRSVTDIILQTGSGYMDSLAGLVFFLLIGRWFQDKTYESLAFDRDYTSYFPLAVYRKDKTDWRACVVHELKKGDEIRIRNREIVPADSLLTSSQAQVDYSFVTGESQPVSVRMGELVYAGGRIVGEPALLTVKKEISQSHLTSLWNNEVFTKPESKNYKLLMDHVAQVFTWTVLALALLTGIYWYWVDSSRVWLIVTSVLMVACPCALALAAPFTYGSMLRVFGRFGLYLKNADVVENMSRVDAIVFDKTGTVTHGSHQINWSGKISEHELMVVKAIAMCSTHPLSMLLIRNIKGSASLLVKNFNEVPGSGLVGEVAGHNVRLGSKKFILGVAEVATSGSRIHIEIDNEYKGYFELGTIVRDGMEALVSKLSDKIKALLSGDSHSEEHRMKSVFSQNTVLAFNQSPQDKLNYIADLQGRGHRVMMLGDGLNDSGALKQSDVGIAVSDDTGVFTPACDGILSGSMLGRLDKFLSLSKSALLILKVSLIISLAYNIVGLTFAATGHLTPLIAAILMPISSISVVAFTTFMVGIVSKQIMK